MAVNKVIFNNTTLLDLTADTVAASNLLNGYTAHDASGAAITGAYLPWDCAGVIYGNGSQKGNQAFTILNRIILGNNPYCFNDGAFEADNPGALSLKCTKAGTYVIQTFLRGSNNSNAVFRIYPGESGAEYTTISAVPNAGSSSTLTISLSVGDYVYMTARNSSSSSQSAYSGGLYIYEVR